MALLKASDGRQAVLRQRKLDMAIVEHASIFEGWLSVQRPLLLFAHFLAKPVSPFYAQGSESVVRRLRSCGLEHNTVVRYRNGQFPTLSLLLPLLYIFILTYIYVFPFCPNNS